MRQLDLSVDSGRAFIDGQPLDLAPGQDPAAALIEHAQGQAAAHGPVLAHVRDGQTDTWLTIASDGTISPAEPPQDESAEPESAPPRTLSQWDVGSSTRTPRTAPHLTRRHALIGGGIVAALALGGTAWAVKGNKPAAAPPPRPTTAPTIPLPDGQYAPHGWSQNARWSIEDVFNPRPVVAVRDDLAAIVKNPPGTGSLAVPAFDANTGIARWVHQLPPSAIITDGPFILPMAGRLTVLVVTEDDLWRWDARTGQQLARNPLPRHQASVGVSLLGPWINKKGSTYLGVTSHGPQSFDVPKGAAPYGIVGDNMLAVDDHGKAWKLTSGKKPGKPTSLSGPKGMTAGPIAIITESLIVVGWSKDTTTRLRAYDVHTLKEKWTSPPERTWATFMGLTQVSPDQTWATVDNRWIDLRTGHTRVLAAKWHPDAISNGYAWGDDGSYLLSCTRAGSLTAGKPDHKLDSSVIVVGGTSNLAYGMGNIGNSNTLYAMPRES